ncbi:cyclase family protein [Roseomonas sp. BN140053]|uniref:cyclase family protein n=1 Tax=Roseomonas sp. BN140053 TaxID=3391898 RepID=UPI0039EAE346
MNPELAWPGHSGNWKRWPNDRGTLNLITPAAVLRGTGSVRLGEVIPCARPVAAAEPLEPVTLFRQEMTHVRDVPDACAVRTQSAADMLTFRVHNMVNTHIDALSHIGFDNRHYDGNAHAEVVTLREGAKRFDITSMLGIVTRGHLIDVARGRGVAWLEPGELVMPVDVASRLDAVEPGDAVLIRTGATLTGGRHSPTDPRGIWSGLHPDTVELLARRDIGVLGADATEPGPSPVPDRCSRPIHVLCLVFYGLPIIHHLDLERLAERCVELGRTEMLLTVGALNVPHATGSPVTPLCVL